MIICRPKNEKTVKKKSRLYKLNILILITHWLYPMWGYCALNTSGISFFPFLGAIVCMIATGIVYRRVSRIKNGKNIMNALRAVLFLCIALIYVPTFVLWGVNEFKIMYNIKRYDYIHGVFGFRNQTVKRCKKVLPERLPEKCEDYSFVTRGALDDMYYRHHSCLIFRTDDETIESYAEYYRDLCDEFESKHIDQKRQKEWLKSFFKRSRIDENRREEFKDAEVYTIDTKIPRGVLLDKDSGYVVILT